MTVALASARRLVELAPDRTRSKLFLADALRESWQTREALKELETADRLEPGNRHVAALRDVILNGDRATSATLTASGSGNLKPGADQVMQVEHANRTSLWIDDRKLHDLARTVFHQLKGLYGQSVRGDGHRGPGHEIGNRSA